MEKTHRMRNCGQYRCAPFKGMSIAEVAEFLADLAVNLRALREVLQKYGVTSQDLLLDVTEAANDMRRAGNELTRMTGGGDSGDANLADRITDCSCPAKGFCERHDVDKTEHWHKLCRTAPAMFQLWEQGRWPGQYSDEVAVNT